MIEVSPNLFVGAQEDYEHISILREHWGVVHACKEPHHREALGYTGRAAPKDHPEYLIARRGNRLILNLIDADDPRYIPQEIMDAAVSYIRNNEGGAIKTLVHCNQGLSRSPTIAFLALAPTLHEDFLTAEEQFNQLYPAYSPAKGVRGYAQAHWERYHAAA